MFEIFPAEFTSVVPASAVKHFLQHIEKAGLFSPRLLKKSGIVEQHLREPAGWIDETAFLRALELALNNATCSLAGLRAAEKIPLNIFGIYFHLMETSLTIRNYIQNSIRYSRLLSDNYRIQAVPLPGSFSWQFEYLTENELIKQHLTDFVLAHWVLHIRHLKPEIVNFPLAVHFQHEAPENPDFLAVYERIFGCPILFSQPGSGLILTDNSLDTPLGYVDPVLAEMLDSHAQKILASKDSKELFVQQVRSSIYSMLAFGTPSREIVANKLGMSGRNLHRKLEDAGTSYRDILEELRFELAQKRLKEGQNNIHEIGKRLGFRESRTFIRWFKGISGTTPSDYRDKIRAVS